MKIYLLYAKENWITDELAKEWIENNQDLTHIQSLVVDPNYFRKGIGRKLVQIILCFVNLHRKINMFFKSFEIIITICIVAPDPLIV